MAIEVTGPDGAVHVFPDGTQPTVIKSAMARHYAPRGGLSAATGASGTAPPPKPLERWADSIHQSTERLKADWQTGYGPDQPADAPARSSPLSADAPAVDRFANFVAGPQAGRAGGERAAAIDRVTGSDLVDLPLSVIRGGYRALTGRDEADASVETGALMAAVPVARGLAGEAGVLARSAPPALSRPSPQPSALADRAAAFDRAGVPPTLAAVGPSGSAQVAKFVAENPIVGGAAKRNLRASVAATGASADNLAGRYGSAAARNTTGENLQTGVRHFARDVEGAIPPDVARTMNSQRLTFATKANALYGRVDRLISDDAGTIPLRNTADAVGRVMTNFDDANLAATFRNGLVNQLGEDILAARGMVSWRDATRLRTTVRERLRSDPALRGTVSDAEIDRIYDGLTADLRAGAERLGGPEATRAFDQANSYYRAGRQRIDGALTKVFDAPSGERAYDSVIGAAMEGGTADVARLLQVKRSLPPDQWGDVAATALRRMGTPTAGAAEVGAEAPTFSVSTFVTNYSKLSPRGREILFGSTGGGGARATSLQAELDNLARVASMQKAVERAANTSNSAVAGQSMAVGAGLIANPAATIMSLVAARGLGEVMTNPLFVRWLTRTATAPPASMASRVAALRTLAEGNPDIAAVLPTFETALEVDRTASRPPAAPQRQQALPAPTLQTVGSQR